MAFRIPPLLRTEFAHRFERLQDGFQELKLRGWINDNPGLVFGVALFSALLLVFVLVRVLHSTPAPALPQPKMAWFYDVNTGKLFLASRKQTGPIAAPSGPTPDGELAGWRAHVYGYVLEPNESELFAGFLERPDPDIRIGKLTSDMSDFAKWARGRLIRRPRDKQWVPATGPEADAILQELLRPNKKGQTPIYQVPRE